MKPLQPLQPMTGKQIAAPAFELPAFDDDDDLPTLVTKKGTDDSGLNFLKGLSGLTH